MKLSDMLVVLVYRPLCAAQKRKIKKCFQLHASIRVQRNECAQGKDGNKKDIFLHESIN